MSMYDLQVGVKKESVWNTPVVVDRFFEVEDWPKQKHDYQRIQSNPLRAGQFGLREDRFTPFYGGSEFPLNMTVMSKGFGFWLEAALGGVATAGPTDSAYTHTFTPAAALSSFTCQINNPYYSTGNSAFTYSGCKVTDWQLSNSVGEHLFLELGVSAKGVSTATGLATASYPTTMEPLTFAGALITIGGSQVDVTEFTVKSGTQVKTDRVYLGGTLKEQIRDGKMINPEWSLKADWDSLTQYNRFASATRAGAVASIVAYWESPTLIGATAKPRLTVTMTKCRFDDFEVDGNPAEQTLSGVALDPTAGSNVTIDYKTADATP